jgi:chromosome transmission fidelity protein 1
MGVSTETQALMKKLGLMPKTEDANETDEQNTVKIFYCSRTHSQLGQFASELQRVRLPPALAVESQEGKAEALAEQLRHLTLGSRKNLCINPKVSRLKSANAINETCLELQKPKASEAHKCAYLPGKDDQDIVNDFRDRAVAKIRDIEDLADLGKTMGVCPYYASRAAIGISEVTRYLTSS